MKLFLFFLLPLFSFSQPALQWVHRFAVDTFHSTSLNDIKVLRNGDVAICGMTSDSNGIFFVFVSRISSSGIYQWKHTFGQWPDDTYLRKIAIDSLDNIYCTGVIRYANSNRLVLNAKILPGGALNNIDTSLIYSGIDNCSPGPGRVTTLIWNGNVTLAEHLNNNLTWSTSNDTNVVLVGVRLDPFKNIFVGGMKMIGNDWVYFVKKFSSTGQFLWEGQINPSNGIYETLEGLEVDNLGNVYLTGIAGLSDSGFALGKFNGIGNLVWVKIYNPSVQSSNRTSISVDLFGNIYQSGKYYSSNSTNNECRVLKYDSSGNLIWTTILDSFGLGSGGTRTLVDKFGDVYVTYPKKSPSLSNIVLVKLSGATGSKLWEYNYGGPAGGHEWPVAMTMDSLGCILIGGYEYGYTTHYGVVLKFCETTGIDNSQSMVEEGFSLFPNPNPGKFTLVRNTVLKNARFEIFDAGGKRVFEKTNAYGNSHEFDCSNLNPGFYVVQVSDWAGVQRQKLIIK